jgi:uncharacterized coiled-coil protein SlyX
MSQQRKKGIKDLDEELNVLRDLIEKENEMLRRMIGTLDALEKKIIRAGEKEEHKRKKS